MQQLSDFLRRITVALDMRHVPYMLTSYIEHWVEVLGVHEQWRAAQERAG